MNTNTKNNTTHYGNPNTNTRNNTTYYGNTNANTSNNTAQHGTMLESPWGCSTVLVRTDKKRKISGTIAIAICMFIYIITFLL